MEDQGPEAPQLPVVQKPSVTPWRPAKTMAAVMMPFTLSESRRARKGFFDWGESLGSAIRERDEGVREHLRARRDVARAGGLELVVADAALTRHEDHPARAA